MEHNSLWGTAETPNGPNYGQKEGVCCSYDCTGHDQQLQQVKAIQQQKRILY